MIKKDFINNIGAMEGVLNYTYNDSDHLILAMTHSSYANENRNERLSSNERLEFLGDAVLNIIISDFIHKNYSSLSEGELTKARASIVCEPSLAKCANTLEVGKYLMLGNSKTVLSQGERGFIKVICDASSKRILGAHLLCDRATDMIGEFATAIVNGLTTENLASVIRPHPTYGEAVTEAIEDVEGMAIHLMPRA
jgi:dsRNA-specific ribonuclease